MGENKDENVCLDEIILLNINKGEFWCEVNTIQNLEILKHARKDVVPMILKCLRIQANVCNFWPYCYPLESKVGKKINSHHVSNSLFEPALLD